MPNEFVTEPSQPPRLFSIRAISVGTFVGGPLTAGIFIGLNYRRLGNERFAKMAFVAGVVSTFVLGLSIMLVPSEISERIPNSFIPMIYTSIAVSMANWLQGDEINRAMQKGALKASGLVITGWSIAALVVTLCTIAPFALAVPPFGFHGDKESFGPDGAYRVYYQGGVSKAELEKLADYLTESGYFNDGHDLAVQVVKQNNDYTLSLPIDRRQWDRPELLDDLRNARSEIEQLVLTGKLTLILVDEDLRKTYRKEL
jgi:hypothetical protein